MQINWSKQEMTNEMLIFKLQKLVDTEEAVMSLDLSDNNIYDFRPLQTAFQSPTLKNSLKMLNLSNNKLTSIAIQQIPSLFSLDLSYNAELTEVILNDLPNIRMIDLRQCKLDDVAMMNLLLCPIFPKNLRLYGNQITDLGVQALIENTQLHPKLLGLTSLELKNTMTTKYTMISQIIKELPEGASQQKKLLPQLKPVDNMSRYSSARSGGQNTPALGAIKKTVNQYIEQLEQTHQHALKRQKLNREMRKQLNEPIDDLAADYIYVQSLIEVLVGTSYKIFSEAPAICAKQGVCTALIAGCKIQTDLEEQIAFGFARKIGTIFCKDSKGANHDCKERCALVLSLIYKKINELDELDKRNEVGRGDSSSLELAVYGKRLY